MAKRNDNAEVMLYGSSASAGYLSVLDGRIVGGSGEPLEGRSLTDATWFGMIKLREAGHTGGAWVYRPDGKSRAYVKRVDNPPYFGDLEWEAAPMLVIKMDDLLAVAEK